MELTNFSLYYGNSVDKDAIGAIAYRNKDQTVYGSIIDDFQTNIVVVYEGEVDEPYIQHFMVRDEHCQIMNVAMEDFRKELLNGTHKVLLKCLLEGDIIKDSDDRLYSMRRDFLTFEEPIRERKLFIGYANFLQKYVDAKMLMKEERLLDAYFCTLEGLHHWAELELLERGIHPNTAVWDQVTGLNTPVRKLYEELTASTETLGQRIELVLLACDFSMVSKLEHCAAPLLRLLRSRRSPWTMQELMLHPELEALRSVMPIVLRQLIYRSIVKEAAVWKEARAYHEPVRYYAE